MKLHGILRTLWLSCMLLPSFAFISHAGKIPKPPKRDFSLVYVDTSSGRLYVSMGSGIMANQDSLVARLRQIRKERTWDMWGDKIVRIALFSDSRFARPKEAVAKQERKDWAGHFLAEFDAKKNVVWLYPALPAKKRKLDLGKDPEEP